MSSSFRPPYLERPPYSDRLIIGPPTVLKSLFRVPGPSRATLLLQVLLIDERFRTSPSFLTPDTSTVDTRTAVRTTCFVHSDIYHYSYSHSWVNKHHRNTRHTQRTAWEESFPRLPPFQALPGRDGYERPPAPPPISGASAYIYVGSSEGILPLHCCSAHSPQPLLCGGLFLFCTTTVVSQD